eukprot:jgi/Tetstr1/445715/TSEL_003514.t1
MVSSCEPLTLEEAFDRVWEVQARKAKKTEIREIHAGTSRVDPDKLCKQWFPDITDKLARHVSGYATQLCHEEMGSSGNYRVVACHEAAAVPDDEDLEGEVTLHPVADVPQVDPGTAGLPCRHFYPAAHHYGYVEQDAAEELLACLVRIEDGFRKRKALEAAAPADRTLTAKIQAVANVQDYNRPDNKAKGRRKCSKWLAVAIMGVSSVLTNLGYFALYALFVSLAALSFKLVTGRMPEFAQPRRKRFRRAMVGAGGKGKKDTGDGTRAAPQDAKQE